MNNNVIRQPMLPDTIHFHHTMGNDQTEVMRISRDGVWVNPDMPVDETAKAVLAALDSHIKTLVEAAVQAERERIIKANAPEIEKVNAYIKNLETMFEKAGIGFTKGGA